MDLECSGKSFLNAKEVDGALPDLGASTHSAVGKGSLALLHSLGQQTGQGWKVDTYNKQRLLSQSTQGQPVRAKTWVWAINPEDIHIYLLSATSLSLKESAGLGFWQYLGKEPN